MFRLFTKSFSTRPIVQSCHFENIAFVPGMLCTKDIWKNQTTALLSQGTNISDVDTLSGKTINEMAGEIPRDSLLVAHSMGCYLALEMADVAPERVKGLILINGTVLPSSDQEKARKGAIIRTVSKLSDETFNKTYIKPEFFKGQAYSALTVDQLSKLILMAQHVGRINFINQVKKSLDRDHLLPIFQRLQNRLPITIVHGLDDKIIFDPGWNALIKTNALNHSVQLIEAPQIGHLTPYEQPERLTGIITGMMLAQHTSSLTR